MSDVEVLTPREVPLGGPRAMMVRRTLPARGRTFVGAWCFVDHYGPGDTAQTGGMRVPPHPHTGLQTVSWLFDGEIEHRDSAGFHAMVRPGELNLMTAGRGISHSEVSTASTTTLHGVQLWVALPAASRFTIPGFEHHVPDLLTGSGITARVFIGRLSLRPAAAAVTSPVRTYSPLLGAEVTLDPGHDAELPADPAFEHGVLLDTGAVEFEGQQLSSGDLGIASPGRTSLRLRATGGGPARLLLLGGTPFGEQIVMWWNFIGRDHDDIVRYRSAWQASIMAPGEDGPAPASTAALRFGLPAGDPLPPLPAPSLPAVRLKPRG